MTGAHLWILGGLFLDGWHHIHDPGLETFFTPWHGVLYSGIGVALAIMWERRRRNRQRGLRGADAVPGGYRLSVIGGAVFVAGGAIDMAWHTLLGIEVGVEALLSPPHLLLAVAGTLVFTAPLRAAWSTLPRRPSWFEVGPALVSLGGVAALLGFFTQYVSPFTHLYPTQTPSAARSADLLAATGVAGIIVTTVITTGAVLVALRRWQLPFGAVTVIVGLSTLLMTTQRGTYGLLPAVLAATLLLDAWLWRGDDPERRVAPRIAGTALPALLFTGYFVTLAVAGSLTWSVHLVTGSVVVAAAAGTLLAALVMAPGPAPVQPPPSAAPAVPEPMVTTR
jgi:hypothetical protein